MSRLLTYFTRRPATMHSAQTCWTEQDQNIQQSTDYDKASSERVPCSSLSPSHQTLTLQHTAVVTYVHDDDDTVTPSNIKLFFW